MDTVDFRNVQDIPDKQLRERMRLIERHETQYHLLVLHTEPGRENTRLRERIANAASIVDGPELFVDLCARR